MASPRTVSEGGGAATTPRAPSMAKAPSVAASQASTLPSIVKSIHGPGVKYYYLSGQKKYDDKFWDPKDNVDLYNWQFHRNKVKNQEAFVDDELSGVFVQHVDKKAERTKQRRSFELEELERHNKFLQDFQATCLPDVSTYHLSDVVETKRVFKKLNSEQDRQRMLQTLNEENKVYQRKMKEMSGSVSFNKNENSFQRHLKQMYKLTRFPILNAHLMKGQLPAAADQPATTPRGSRMETPRDQQANSDRTNQPSRPTQPPSRRSMKNSETVKATGEKSGKGKTLISARKETTIVQAEPANVKADEEPPKQEQENADESKPEDEPKTETGEPKIDEKAVEQGDVGELDKGSVEPEEPKIDEHEA